MYIVIAYRSNYNFPIGVFESYTLAEKASESHNISNEDKHVIFECVTNKIYDADEAKFYEVN